MPLPCELWDKEDGSWMAFDHSLALLPVSDYLIHVCTLIFLQGEMEAEWVNRFRERKRVMKEIV